MVEIISGIMIVLILSSPLLVVLFVMHIAPKGEK